MRPQLPASSRKTRGTHDHRGGPPKTERPESLHQERPINHLLAGRLATAAAGPDKAGRPRSNRPQLNYFHDHT
jgi:hypothetical protein